MRCAIFAIVLAVGCAHAPESTVDHQETYAVEPADKPIVTPASQHKTTPAELNVITENITRTFEAHAPAIRGCYNALLRRAPSAKGTIIVEFLIGENGQPYAVTSETNDLPSDLVTCVEGDIHTMRFAPHIGHEEMRVRHPFHFGVEPQ